MAYQYRVGDFEPAIKALKKSNTQGNGGTLCSNGIFLAMAYWDLGNKDEARRWYDEAVDWMDKNMPDDKGLRRFRAEAEKLMGIEENHKDTG